VRVSILSTGLLAALAACACGQAPPSGGAPLESRRSGQTERESYRPPSDGVLSPGQVETFLKVRAATVRIAGRPGPRVPLEGEEGISGASEARASEIRAARALSVPVEEYLWVRERILEAEAATLAAKLNADVLALLGRTLDSLRSSRLQAPDDDSRQVLDEQIASFAAEEARVRREAGEREPEAVRANLAVLAPYRGRLSTIADELAHLRAASVPVAPGTIVKAGDEK
jgi:hypothetical protein